MAWTAKLVSIDATHDNRRIYVIEYANGGKSFQKSYASDAVTDALLQQAATAEFSRLNAADSADVVLKIKINDLIPALVVEPVVVDQQKEQFFSDTKTLLSLKRALELGLVDADDSRIVALQTSLKASISDELIGIM